MSERDRNEQRGSGGRAGGPRHGGGASGEPGRDKGSRPGPAQPRMNRNAMGWLVLIGLMLGILVMFQAVGPQGEEVNWQEFKNLWNGGQLSDVELRENRIVAVRKEGPEGEKRPVLVVFNPGSRDSVRDDLVELTEGAFREAPGPSIWMQLLISPLIWTVVFFLIIWFVIIRGLRSAGGGGGMLGSFGKSRHRVLAKESTGVTFDDVAGVDEAKDELREIVEFLKNPKKFMRLGGRIPRGVLLTGEPGCGKTLLAKAIAGEADVPFFSISGSDFVEMFVGVGASRVRDLFKQAKESAPCIIFLDEIDAVGRRRGGGFTTGGHDEREQTLNAILVEMDGFDTSDQVIVIAATNRPDVLDPALTRPGRFDRQVAVPLPDVKGRLEILQVHARKVKLGPDVELERIARGTPMFSGAELAAIINEAAIAATLHEKDFVEQEDLEEARDKIRFGRSRKSRVLEEKERTATAYHEAGHAVLQVLLPNTDPLHKVTIIPRGQSLGATFSLPERDRYGYAYKYLHSMMRVVCGGRIAEQRKTGDISSGAAMDIQQLTMMARHMVLDWGMSEKLGFVRYGAVDTRDAFIAEREYSEETARLVDEEIRRFAAEAYRDAEKIINENWDKVVRLGEALLKHETLSAPEVEKLMKGEPLSKPTISELLSAEAKRSAGATPALPQGRETTGEGPLSLTPAPA